MIIMLMNMYFIDFTIFGVHLKKSQNDEEQFYYLLIYSNKKYVMILHCTAVLVKIVILAPLKRNANSS